MRFPLQSAILPVPAEIWDIDEGGMASSSSAMLFATGTRPGRMGGRGPRQGPRAVPRNCPISRSVMALAYGINRAEFHLTMNTRFRDMRNGRFFLGKTVFFYRRSNKSKMVRKRVGAGIIIGRFRNNSAIVHLRGVISQSSRSTADG